MSTRLRVALLAGSALILALELPALGRLLHHDLFGPRPALASARAHRGGARVGSALALAALGLVPIDAAQATTEVPHAGDREPR
jgi:hypothetical protein